MNSKALLTIIAFLIWSAGSTYWYVCKIKGFCAQAASSTVTSEKKEATSSGAGTEEMVRAADVNIPEGTLVYFPYEDSRAVIPDTAAWKKFASNLRAEISPGKKLQVRVPAYSSEISAVERLGEERGKALKILLLPYIDSTRVLVEIQILPGEARSRPAGLSAAEFKWVRASRNVTERGNKVLIHFPLASDRAILTADVNRYLDELAEELKQHPEWKAKITGYTDNTGSYEANKYWGMRRARKIAALLRAKGVNPNQLIVESGGEDNPVAPNDTPEGRKLNRRVEIEIIKS